MLGRMHAPPAHLPLRAAAQDDAAAAADLTAKAVPHEKLYHKDGRVRGAAMRVLAKLIVLPGPAQAPLMIQENAEVRAGACTYSCAPHARAHRAPRPLTSRTHARVAHAWACTHTAAPRRATTCTCTYICITIAPAHCALPPQAAWAWLDEFGEQYGAYRAALAQLAAAPPPEVGKRGAPARTASPPPDPDGGLPGPTKHVLDAALRVLAAIAGRALAGHMGWLCGGGDGGVARVAPLVLLLGHMSQRVQLRAAQLVRLLGSVRSLRDALLSAGCLAALLREAERNSSGSVRVEMVQVGAWVRQRARWAAVVPGHLMTTAAVACARPTQVLMHTPLPPPLLPAGPAPVPAGPRAAAHGPAEGLRAPG